MPRLPASEYQKKLARNKAIQIYTDLKLRCKTTDLTGQKLVNLIREAMAKTEKEVKVAEIRNEILKKYEAMIQQVSVVVVASAPPEKSENN